jgi:hypothetical protein
MVNFPKPFIQWEGGIGCPSQPRHQSIKLGGEQDSLVSFAIHPTNNALSGEQGDLISFAVHSTSHMLRRRTGFPGQTRHRSAHPYCEAEYRVS